MSRDALVVGINIYQNAGLKNLTSPAADAEAIAQMLEKHGDFDVVRRFPEAISDANKPFVGKKLEVSLKDLKKALVQLFKPDGKHIPETALFYFSGHGLRNTLGISEGFLATSDSHPDLEFYGLSMNWFRQLLAESPIRQQVIWLDCCHSGELLISDANPGNQGLAGDRCFIASSREFETSLSDLQSPYSVMTKALLEGLDPNRLPGRGIDTFALADYVNQALKSEPQTPICTHFGSGIRLMRSPHIQADDPEEDHEETGICPYKGLEFFDCNDEDPKYFFGQDILVDELLDKVRTSNFMALVGASGNGKSSVLRAGLLHQLKQGKRITGSDNWRIRITRPDKTPIRNLAFSLFDQTPSDMELNKITQELKTNGTSTLKQFFQNSLAPRTILVVDQFEEVFTRCESLEERETYLACLMEALTEPKLCLIIAMRADFIGKCLEHEYSGLAQRIQKNMISVLPMQRAELEAAICQPAKQVKLKVEQTLVTQILNEIAGAPGSLPLLQYTLKELWQQREKNQLTFAAYQELGGITGTLNKRATEIYNSFQTKVEKDATRHIFLKLTQLGEGTEDTKRRVLQSSLIAEPKYSAALIEKVIAKLADPENRLIVTSKSEKDKQEAIVDVSHKALIRNWQLLRKWIESNRDLLRQQRKIEADAEAWQKQNKNVGYLLQGLPLNEAELFRKKHQDRYPLSETTKSFIEKSTQNQRIQFLKIASVIITPILILSGLIEAQYRENNIEKDYEMLTSISIKSVKKKAILNLIQGCPKTKKFKLQSSYLTERFFGNCRTLLQAQLNSTELFNSNFSHSDLYETNFIKADLYQSDFSYTNLNNSNLTSTDLRYANLSNSNLSDADFSYTDLSHANLQFANLSSVNFHQSLLLNTNLRNSKNLKIQQLSASNKVYICNIYLPINIRINTNRDCEKMPQILHEKYPWLSLEKAKEMIMEAKVKEFETLSEEN